MCTVFCPTGALVLSKEKPPVPEASEGEDESAKAQKEREAARGQYLEFSTADCVQCNSCADICLKKCLTVDPVVRTEELMSFDPRLIWIPSMQKNNMLGKGLRGRK